MFLAYQLYKESNELDLNEPTIRNIIKYNEIDCKVLWEILRYLRTHLNQN